MPAQAPAKQQARQAPPVRPQPFRVGIYDTETNDYDNSVTMTTGQINFPNYVASPNGWLKGFWCMFECVTAANAATVAFKADAPFSAIAKVTFTDVGNREIFGPLSGYDWAQVMKWGGYFEVGDPRSDVVYNATTGSGATAGSFTLVMYLPIEVTDRDSLGDIENKSSSSSFKITIVLDASTNVYSTAPTTLGTVRLRIVEDGYTEPLAADAMGRPLSQAPPAAGAIQYWAFESQTLNTGAAKYAVQNGLGFSIRNLIFKLTDSTGSRAQGDLDWPDPVTLSYGKIQLFQRYQKIWKSRIAKAYGLTSTTADASLGLENGVYPYWLTRDFGLKPGAELHNEYIVTKTGTLLQWAGTIGGSGTHTLTVLSNYVVPPSNDPAILRAAR
jgi:hypothetical protein